MPAAKTCAGLLMAGWLTLAPAAPTLGELPPETAELKTSALPGYAIALQKCAVCHSADYIQFQPPGMNLSQWTGVVAKMQHEYGAPITDDEIREVGAYLAVVYGSAQESALPAELGRVARGDVAAAGAADIPAASSSAGGALEARALLEGNNCLACHAIDKKVVGPALREVARKYEDNPQALARIEAGIRSGGSGKWGAIPMPPFAQLTPKELRTLAEFVLKQ